MLSNTTSHVAHLLPTSDHNMQQNIKTIRKELARNNNRRKKNKRFVLTQETNVHQMPYENNRNFYPKQMNHTMTMILPMRPFGLTNFVAFMCFKRNLTSETVMCSIPTAPQ